jgi:hypothetical protein
MHLAIAALPLFFPAPPQRGRDLNSKTINQTAALPIHAPAPLHWGEEKHYFCHVVEMEHYYRLF